MSPRSKPLDWLARIPLAVWLFLALWLFYGILINSSNLTEFNLQQLGVEAIVERGHFYVEGSPTPQLQPQGDVFAFQNHLYAAKQPGQFMAGALVYFVLRAFGLSYLHQFLLTSALVTWFTASWITALAAVVVYLLGRALVPSASPLAALGVALVFGLATTAFPYAGIAHHDAIASGYLILAFYLVFCIAQNPAAQLRPVLSALAGLLLGLTITTSVLPLLMAVVVGIYFLSLRQWRALPFFLIGGLVGLAPLLYYDAVNFGKPLVLPNIAGNFSDTFFHFDADNFLEKINFYAVFVTLYAPIVWFGLLGWFLLPKARRREQTAGLAMVTVLLTYTLNIDTVGNCQFGPRYLLPVMPLAALGLVGFTQIRDVHVARALTFALVALGVVSFFINLSGASFGAMFCALDRYAVLDYINAALRAKFWSYPLVPALLNPFLISILLFAIALLGSVPPYNTVSAITLSEKNRSAFRSRVKALSVFQPLLLLILLVAFFLRVFRLWEVPPGLWLDEGFYGLDALRFLQHPSFTFFFPQNGGREPLFIYFQSLALGLWGAHSWVLRVVPVIAGVLTVALVYRLGVTLFARHKQSRAIGLVSAAALAVSYWHVSFSRLGMRVILLPLFGTLTMWLFWRAWESRRRRDFAFCGVALGFTLYTYLAARVLPLVLVIFIVLALILLWVDRRGRARSTLETLTPRAALVYLGIILAVAFLVSLPLLSYLAFNPADLLGRTDSVSLTPENIAQSGGPDDMPLTQALAENTVRVAGMFFVSGDLNPRHNLPARPALDWLTALGFVVGLGIAIVRLRREWVYALVLLWLAAMLLPSVLSTEAPHFLRTLGALPPLMLLVADGLTQVWQKFLPRRSLTWLVLLVLVIGGVGTFRDYFITWANLPALTQEAFDVNSQYMAERILQEIPKSDVLVPLRLYGRPTMQFALDQSFPDAETLSAPPLPQRPLIIITSQGAADKQWVLLHQDASGGHMVYFPHVVGGLAQQNSGDPQYIQRAKGVRAGQVIPLRGQAQSLIVPPQPETPLDANFDGQIQLVGYDLNPSRLTAGQTVEVALYWKPLKDLQRDYSVFVHIVDAAGNVHAQWDSQPVFGFYTTGLWRRNTIVTDLYPIHIPADTPAGEYQLEAGWVSGAQERLSVVNARSQSAGDSVIFGKLVVTSP